MFLCSQSPCVCVADPCEWRACEIMAELVEGLQSTLSLGHPKNSAFPAFLTPTLRNVIISLSRLPLVNSHTRVPPLVRACSSKCWFRVSLCGCRLNTCVHAGLETGLVPPARRRIRHRSARDPCGLPAREGCLQRVPVPHQHSGYRTTLQFLMASQLPLSLSLFFCVFRLEQQDSV